MYYQPSSNHVFFEQRKQGEARFGRSRRILKAPRRNAEPHGFKAHGNVVRPVQGDCGVHAPGVAAVAGQRGPD
jgi:hypothetical protein